MKRSRRRYRLGALTLPEGVKPWHIGLGLAALGGIAYFAFRKTETEAAVDEAQKAVEAGEASPDAAAAAVVAVQGPQAAQKTVADQLAPALVTAAIAEAGVPTSQTEKVVKTKILASLIKSGRVRVPSAITKMALARKLSHKTGVGTGAKKVKPKLDPCRGLTGKAATDCRANKAFSQLPSF